MKRSLWNGSRPTWARAHPVSQSQPAKILADEGVQPLDPVQGIDLVTWNVGKRRENAAELAKLARDSDLVCLQEAMPDWLPLDQHSASFAESFRLPGQNRPTHGLATISGAPEIDECSHAISSRWKEGWVITPKMILCTEYALHRGSLLVVNIHALNFQPVFKYMLSDQLARIAHRVKAHEGPAVVCGDFNTWRKDRKALVNRWLSDFEEIPFEESGHRKRAHWAASFALGSRKMALDHIFVRGLHWSGARVLPRHYSDHGALAVRLFQSVDDQVAL